MAKKQNYKKICPKCGSTDIIPWTKYGLTEGELLIDYCKNCYYGHPNGGFFPEVEESQIEEFRDELKEKKKWK